MKPYQPSEHDIQSAILNILPYYGVYAWRNNSGMLAVGEGKYRRMVRMGKAGMPDILGVQKNTGKLVAIEVKRTGNKPTMLQEQTMNELRNYGAIVFVATSIDDVKTYLKDNNHPSDRLGDA